jgi:hypothetical protein
MSCWLSGGSRWATCRHIGSLNASNNQCRWNNQYKLRGAPKERYIVGVETRWSNRKLGKYPLTQVLLNVDNTTWISIVFQSFPLFCMRYWSPSFHLCRSAVLPWECQAWQTIGRGLGVHGKAQWRLGDRSKKKVSLVNRGAVTDNWWHMIFSTI